MVACWSGTKTQTEQVASFADRLLRGQAGSDASSNAQYATAGSLASHSVRSLFFGGLLKKELRLVCPLLFSASFRFLTSRGESGSWRGVSLRGTRRKTNWHANLHASAGKLLEELLRHRQHASYGVEVPTSGMMPPVALQHALASLDSRAEPTHCARSQSPSPPAPGTCPRSDASEHRPSGR
jgi:hypothetical protein